MPAVTLLVVPVWVWWVQVKAYTTVKNSGTNWLGQTENDPLQRIYGISFPDKERLKKWVAFQEAVSPVCLDLMMRAIRLLGLPFR
jgi:hypothetical protein